MRGRPKKIKNIANKASRRVGLSSENNRKAAKFLAGDTQDINHGWDATVCVYLSAATNCKYFSAMVCYVVYQTLP